MSYKRTKTEAHQRALEKDVRDLFDVGETLDVVISESPDETSGKEAMSYVSSGNNHKIRTFVDPNNFHLHAGDLVRVRVTGRGENHLDAVALFKLD